MAAPPRAATLFFGKEGFSLVFSSLIFLFGYLPIVLLVHKFTPLRFRNLVLLLFNLFFYGWGEPVYICLMVFSTVIDYTHGLLVEKFRARDRLARLFVASSVVLNLSLLFFFKYYDFVAGMLGLPLLGLPLPIGISFYTFQTMSYTIDVYRRDAPVQRNLISFGTYVTLFPQLIAGPIVKYKEVARELSSRTITVEKFASGVLLFIAGLSKKVLLANNIGALWDYYKVQASPSTLGAWLGIFAFSFQLYFDFSGYSDMARGLGRMFGFEFLENFNYPYLSKSASEFWRRWHISLGSWFREYLYIPLGGNRKGIARTILNLSVVWLLTGLWHGASWNFVLWGAYYGLILILEKLFLLRLLDRLPGAIRHLYALAVVLFGWVLFAVEDLHGIVIYFSALFGRGEAFLPADLYQLQSYLPLLLVLAIGSTPLARTFSLRLPQRARNLFLPAAAVLGLFFCTAYLVDATYNPFLYFRF